RHCRLFRHGMDGRGRDIAAGFWPDTYGRLGSHDHEIRLAPIKAAGCRAVGLWRLRFRTTVGCGFLDGKGAFTGFQRTCRYDPDVERKLRPLPASTADSIKGRAIYCRAVARLKSSPQPRVAKWLVSPVYELVSEYPALRFGRLTTLRQGGRK